MSGEGKSNLSTKRQCNLDLTGDDPLYFSLRKILAQQTEHCRRAFYELLRTGDKQS